MTIQYIAPLSRGIARMRRDLLNPFDLKKWFVIGFTAFLAGLGEFRSSGFPGSSFRRRSNIGWEDVLYFPQRAWGWLAAHPGWAMVVAFVVFLGLVIGITLAWLSSRGKFMFLDNVVRGRAKVAEPWYEYANEGNSFFLWSFSLGIIGLVIFVAYLWYCVVTLQGLYESSRSLGSLIVPAVLAGFGFLLISVITTFVWVLFRDFVVPIMYRDRVSGSEAVQKFADLLSSNFIYFVGYGLFSLCILVVVLIIVVLFGLVTCCVGFIVLAIPYINAVILLPVSYALRAFSVEFLEQFGPGFDIVPKPDVNPSGPQTMSA